MNQERDFIATRNEDVESARHSSREEIFQRSRNQAIKSGNLNNYNSHDLLSIGTKQSEEQIEEKFQAEIQKFRKTTYTMDLFEDLVRAIKEQNILRKHYGIIGISRLLCKQTVENVIQAGIVPLIIEDAQRSIYPWVQQYATLALCNLAIGTNEQCQYIADKGGIPVIVKLLDSPSPKIVENVVWTIGNMCYDCSSIRDIIVGLGGLQKMVNSISNSDALVNSGCWAIWNIYSAKPVLGYDLMQNALLLICRLFSCDKITEQQTIIDFLKILTICRSQQKAIEIMIDSNVIPKIVSLLKQPSTKLIQASLSLLGNVAEKRKNTYSDILICSGILDGLTQVMRLPLKKIGKNICWMMSHIVAGDGNQVKELWEKHSLLLLISEFLQTCQSQSALVNISYIFYKYSSNGQPFTVLKFYEETNIIKYCTKALESYQQTNIELVLRYLTQFLAHGQKYKQTEVNPLVIQLKEPSVIQTLALLQYHRSKRISKLAISILNTYFPFQDQP